MTDIAKRAASKDPGAALAALLAKAGIEAEDIGSVEKVRLSQYQQGYKDADGEAHVLDLEATSVVLSPSWDAGPQWEPPSPRKVTVRWGGSKATARMAPDGLARLLVVPDTQVHYRMISTGTRSWDLDPFHDLSAMSAAVAVARYIRPDRICMVGDGMDNPQFGRFTHEQAAAMGFNAGLEDMQSFLMALRAVALVDYLEGNHDLRMSTWALNNARQAYGIKRAKDTHGTWPVMSVPFLLSLDEIDVNYVPGYPANYVDYGPRLRAVHGSKVKPKDIHHDEGGVRCVVHGHVHWAHHRHYRGQGYGDPIQSWVATPGCLCRIDNAVPGVKSGTDPRTNRSVDKPNDWQQGLGLVTYDPEDPSFTPRWEHIPIENGTAHWRDELIVGSYSTDRDDRIVF